MDQNRTLEEEIRRIADTMCKNKHPDYYDSMICVGPGSEEGFGPPCDGCIEEARLRFKGQQKAPGRQFRRNVS